MIRRVKLIAQSTDDLRRLLDGSGADIGCRPVAVPDEDGVNTTVLADDKAFARLVGRAGPGRSIVELETIADLETRIGLVGQGNRFLDGRQPTGFGTRID